MNKPTLNAGETLVGLLSDKDLNPYWLILLHGDNDNAPWQQQMEWAKSIGGDLPTKLEAAMLFANAKDQFQPTWYWTNETSVNPNEPENTDYAWVQDFNYGFQCSTFKGYNSLARAVRREVVK